MKVFNSAALAIACSFALGCASSDGGYRTGTEPDMSAQSTAPGWAYAAEGFTFGKRQPVREKNSYQFYYKHCDLSNDNLPFYSKTAYECTDPY